MLVISTLAGCASDRKVRNADPQETGSSSNAPDEVTRGMHIEGRLGFDHALQVRRSKIAVSHELHDGDEVTTGDRIRASVVTSEDAYLYLAFCAHHELAIYPSQRGVRTASGTPKLVPEGNGELVVDGDPGTEDLYLILSRTELSLADPHLAAAIAGAGHEAKTMDCGASLDAELASPTHHTGSAIAAAPSSTTKVIRGDSVPKKPMPASTSRYAYQPSHSRGSNSGSSSENGRSLPADAGSPANPIDEPDFIRNPGTIVWYGADGINGPGELVAADTDGIAVVRYRFTHVAPMSPP
jgi:hypothetical protein